VSGVSVTATAPAKINLCLGVGPVRPDGFHPLATVYQAVDLHDRVTVRDADDLTVAVTSTGPDPVDLDDVPRDGTNIAVRAARMLAEHHGAARGVAIEVDKAIPVAGGMAGGSADAAATLLACDRLWGLGTPRHDLLALAAELGSDVPFALVGGTAVGTGRGERVSPLEAVAACWWVVVRAPVGLPTPSVYGELDRLRGAAPVADPVVPEPLLEALHRGDLRALGAALVNDLQPAALSLRPELATTLALGSEAGAHGALLSGSGPSVLFLAGGPGHAAEVAARLSAHGHARVLHAHGPVPGARLVTDRRT
jgi:4-diphosphocytidyl-2-C-methyl-D-erythritol kinase